MNEIYVNIGGRRVATILLVDNDIEALDYYKLLLEEFGYNTLLACDGARGVKLIRENKQIDIIISDMQMPPGEWGGIWLIEQVKSGSDIPIIILSEKGTVSKAVEAIKLGAKDYVEKARVEEELIPVIEKVLLQKQSQNNSEAIQVSLYYEALRNTLGNIWDKLFEDTKQFLASSESIYHKHAFDTNFDFSTGIIELTKAVESECNNKIITYFKEYLRKQSFKYPFCIRGLDGKEIALQNYTNNLTSGQLTWVLNQTCMQDYCKKLDINYDNIKTLANFLNDMRLKYRRNDAAHNKIIDIKTYEMLRSRVLGIENISPFKVMFDIVNKEEGRIM